MDNLDNEKICENIEIKNKDYFINSINEFIINKYDWYTGINIENIEIRRDKIKVIIESILCKIKLRERDWNILKSLNCNEFSTLKKVSEKFNLSISRIRDIENRFLHKLSLLILLNFDNEYNINKEE